MRRARRSSVPMTVTTLQCERRSATPRCPLPPANSSTDRSSGQRRPTLTQLSPTPRRPGGSGNCLVLAAPRGIAPSAGAPWRDGRMARYLTNPRPINYWSTSRTPDARPDSTTSQTPDPGQFLSGCALRLMCCSFSNGFGADWCSHSLRRAMSCGVKPGDPACSHRVWALLLSVCCRPLPTALDCRHLSPSAAPSLAPRPQPPCCTPSATPRSSYEERARTEGGGR